MINQYAGFSAQNVRSAIPEAVGTSSNGFLSLQDRPILATVVNAIKDIAAIAGSFKANLIAWLGSAANGLTKIYTQQLCVGDGANDNAPVCITKTQLQAILTQVSAAGTPAGVSASGGVAGVGATQATSTVNASSTPLIPPTAPNPVNQNGAGNQPATSTAASTTPPAAGNDNPAPLAPTGTAPSSSTN